MYLKKKKLKSDGNYYLYIFEKDFFIKLDFYCFCLYDMLLGGITLYKQEYRGFGFNQIDKKNCFNFNKSIF